MAAANNGSVNIHEVTIVKPVAFSNSTAELCLPLTLFDTYWLNFLPVERLFFFQITDLTCDSFNSTILPKLKHSLSLTLFHYLPLAGNLMWPPVATRPAIYYFPGDGVSVTVADSISDFNLLSSDGIREAAEFRPLTPKLSISDDKAQVIAIQITLFPNQGFTLGISNHHAIFDGKSSTTFIKSWACLCQQLLDPKSGLQNPSLPSELTPSFDRTVIKDPKGIDMMFINNWIDFTNRSNSDPNKRSLKVLPSWKDVSNLVRATLVLTREDIKRLRNKINQDMEAKQSDKHRLSTFVVACAYAFTCLVKVRGGDSSRDVIYAFTADYRSRLDPPVPMNYFGNCVGSHFMTAKAGDFTKATGVAFVAEKLSEAVKEIEGGITLEGFEKKFSELMATIQSIAQGVQGIGIAGSNRFDVYGSDFGWGRPQKVEIVAIDTTGAIALAESRDGDGGVEVGVALGKQELEDFASLFKKGLKDLIV